MDTKSKNIQLQYQGYLNTPLLWEQTKLYGLKQLYLPMVATAVFNRVTASNLRLGKLVEQFVSTQLSQYEFINVLLENFQVQNGKQTIGEFDCILEYDEKPIHLEIIYKFYLYDENVGTSEIEHWIGPNRNDTLLKKLTKLKEKQLPLLYNIHAKTALEALNLKAETIEQRVLFKAQLFIPYTKRQVEFKTLNEACLSGFYINHTEIDRFKDCKFYIPSKKNWLVEVHSNVAWQTYSQFSIIIRELIAQKMAPLCWIKFPNGTLQKFFIVWWSYKEKTDN
ncbi:protein of unknown function (DUF1853) [Galbibacter orientalis DSM 19592]|uniref:DUF1853 domain-containing protein n=1 Tax=Galbibacter orientalis DSM 19592 TaxID=926559 RepID=I3CAA9_9FLAO|nr:DUF1853 family protein [Galbibacter orientalis]EIJ40552.1 protein of unknown function (DUF1853) [Galbibacter orientalis DSM 19592]